MDSEHAEIAQTPAPRTLERLRSRLAEVGEQWRRAEVEELRLRRQVDAAIEEAALAGMQPWQLEHLSGRAASTVRKIRRNAGLPPAPRGGVRRNRG